MSLLIVSSLCKEYGKDKTLVKAINNINLEINEGEFIIILGSSGSGKSTLLHILGGVETSTSGSIMLNGEDISKYNDDKLSKYRREEVNIIYQFYNLIPTLTVKENIELPLKLSDKVIDTNYLDNIIKILKLNDRLNHIPDMLSGGEKQRVAIGRSLLCKPKILLADEPTGNLDVKNSDNIMKLLEKCNKDFNQTIVMVTHNNELVKYASRVIKIEDGSIVSDESVL